MSCRHGNQDTVAGLIQDVGIGLDPVIPAAQVRRNI